MASRFYLPGYTVLPAHPLLALPKNPPKLPSSAKPRVTHNDGLDWAFPPAWEVYASSPTDSDGSPSSPAPSDSGSETETPSSQSKTGPHRHTKTSKTSRKGPDHIPRPPNPWILFRSQFIAEKSSILNEVERDYRQISRVAAATWHEMSDKEKSPYRLRAKEVKEEHRRKYPNYVFKPTTRPKQTRQTNRNGPLDLERNRGVAAILMNKELDDVGMKAAVAALDKDLERKRLQLEAVDAARKAAQTKPPPPQQIPPTATSRSSPPPPPPPPPQLPFLFHPPSTNEPIWNAFPVPPSFPASTASPVNLCEPASFAETAGHTWNVSSVAQPSITDASSESANFDEILQMLGMQTFSTGFEIPQVPQVPAYPQMSQSLQNQSFGWPSGQNLDPSCSNFVNTNVLQDPTFTQISDMDFMGGAIPSQNTGFVQTGFQSQPNFPAVYPNAPPLFDLNVEVPAGEQPHFFGQQNFDFIL